MQAKVLMCAPEYFQVEYDINPWMTGNLKKSQRGAAQDQWHALKKLLQPHAEIVSLPPIEHLPDLVFTANAGLVAGKKVILSNFKHPERQGEEEYFYKFFNSQGYHTLKIPDCYFEGAGDALFDGTGSCLWAGYGFRTELRAYEAIKPLIECDIEPMELLDQRFYHLDTCFCPLAHGEVMIFKEAFSEESLKRLYRRKSQEEVIEVTEEDALYFACNAVNIKEHIIVNNASESLKNALRDRGYKIHTTPLTEFMLAGGAAKCLTLQI